MSVSLRLYNTLSKKEERFTPINPNFIRMYVCGPTLYDSIHIGNARPIVIFDLLFRLLRQLYGEKNVFYVRNITDLDDKINARACLEYPDQDINKAISLLTVSENNQFQKEVRYLSCLDPTSQPKATLYLSKIREIINQLIDKGFAYVSEDHVIFSIDSMNKLGPIKYGTLSHRSVEELQPGSRIKIPKYKKSPFDFVLWKPSKKNEPAWNSPANIATKGRPGWHIECSAMSMAQLLEPFGGGILSENPDLNCFDIHGGGLDLIFPHHENEIAQTCCALNNAQMARYWVHNGFLQVEGQKMSKSLGNFVKVEQILNQNFLEISKEVPSELKKHWAGLAARFSLFQTHYREPINWTKKRLTQSSSELYKWYQLLRKTNVPVNEQMVSSKMISILSDDLATPRAITYLRKLYKEKNGTELYSGLSLLGLMVPEFVEQPKHPLFEKKAGLSTNVIEEKISERLRALKNNDWVLADSIRNQLNDRQIVLQDYKDLDTGEKRTRWYHK